MTEFTIKADYDLTGDQPEAVDALSEGVLRGDRFQTLLGVTGSGKTFTMANVIERVKKPTLVIAHNKTLAAQLCNEFREFLPDNAVEYFVSYYDYYQPEAYVPAQDIYIEKDSSINDEIDRLRHAATTSLFLRRDVVIVASVSCIYGLGSPEEYLEKMVLLQVGQTVERDEMLRKLVDIQYERNDVEPARGKFRVRGDSVEIWPASQDTAIRVQLWGDEVEQLVELRPRRRRGHREAGARGHLPGHALRHQRPGHRALAGRDPPRRLEERCAWFEEKGKLLEAQRLRQRTQYDMEMLREMGYCNGIENYSRILLGKAARRHAQLPARLLPGRLPLLRRRVAHDAAADPRHVRGRPQSRKQHAGGLRLPPAQRARQPAAALRRVPREGAAARLRVRHARASSSWPTASTWSSRSSGPPASSTPRSRCGPPRGRSTTS